MMMNLRDNNVNNVLCGVGFTIFISYLIKKLWDDEHM